MDTTRHVSYMSDGEQQALQARSALAGQRSEMSKARHLGLVFSDQKHSHIEPEKKNRKKHNARLETMQHTSRTNIETGQKT